MFGTPAGQQAFEDPLLLDERLELLDEQQGQFGKVVTVVIGKFP